MGRRPNTHKTRKTSDAGKGRDLEVKDTRGILASQADGMYPWERRKDETAAAYRLFKIYLNIPAVDRSLHAAWVERAEEEFDKTGKKVSSCVSVSARQWFEDHQWQERANAYDRYIDGGAHESAVSFLAKEYTAQGQVAQFIYTKAAAALNRKTDAYWDGLSPRDLGSYMRLGFEVAKDARERLLQLSAARLASKEPTDLSEFFDEGSTQESIMMALMEEDWSKASDLLEQMIVVQARSTGQSIPTRLETLSQEERSNIGVVAQLLIAGARASSPGVRLLRKGQERDVVEASKVLKEKDAKLEDVRELLRDKEDRQTIISDVDLPEVAD